MADWMPYGCEIVIVDASPKPSAQAQNLKTVDGVRYFHAPQVGIFSAGVARDIGAQNASRDFIFFFDVDLVFTPELVKKIQFALPDLENFPLSFLMIPCLYLKKDATREVERDRQRIEDYWRAYLLGDFSGIINLAVASSAIVMHRKTYLSTGGHQHEFAGHGCEDLELINRLTLEYPLGRRESDHYFDIRQDVIAKSVGFRRYFSYYGLPIGLKGMLIAHRWHNRPLSARYFRSRNRNDALFKDFLEKADRIGLAPPALPDLNVRGRTLIISDDDIQDIQALRQFLPELGEYQLTRLDKAPRPAGNFKRVLYVGKNASRFADTSRNDGYSARGVLCPLDGNQSIWRLCWWDTDQNLIRDELHEGVRRHYIDKNFFRWIFFRGEDQLTGRQLYCFTPPFYENLDQLPKLEQLIIDLMHKSDIDPEGHFGLFMNQWGQAKSSERFVRQMRKLILKPKAFLSDSRLFRRFRLDDVGGRKP